VRGVGGENDLGLGIFFCPDGFDQFGTDLSCSFAVHRNEWLKSIRVGPSSSPGRTIAGPHTVGRGGVGGVQLDVPLGRTISYRLRRRGGEGRKAG
jgi:hypothetical protein